MDNTCTILNNNNVDEVPITNEEYEHILEIQQEILSLTALEYNTQKILDKICKMAEALLPNALSSLMLKDNENGLMYVKAAPTVPDIGWSALNGIKPGPHSGSCGNAVHHGKPQYIINTFTDDRGIEFLRTAKEFNLCSCWSMPVKNEQGETIGSFALSSFEHRSPAPFHKRLLEVGSALASIVLKSETTKQKLQDALYNDSITGLKNKKSLERDLNIGVFQTLILLDISNFSYVNTAYGFSVGDKLLVKVASLLKEMFEENIYIINADQFALRFDTKEDIEKTVKKIKIYFATKLINIDTINMKVSFSYGGVYADKNILKHAALAIKKAKENGKNRLHIFNKEIDSSNKRKEFILMNTCVYDAFKDNLFIPYFQGIYDNTLNKITKYEALARIITKDGRVITPFEFLEVTKLSGLLTKLSKLMIDTTFKYMSNNDYDFSINITEDDLNNFYLDEYLREKTAQYNIKPYRLTLEILEGISSKGQKNNINQLKSLKRAGYKIAIDDFGAEYSNFERILELDIDFIKIDARYIKNIDTDKKSYEIVKAIVGFADNMYITTIAEFVHSEAVQQVVKDLGIKYSQGFHFSKPNQEII